MMRKQTAIAAALAGMLLSAGCTTISSNETRLPMSSMNHCAAPAGVSLNYGSLTIALGERPNAGYSLEMVGQQESEGRYELIYREQGPQPGRMYAQVITEPCLQVILPKGWQAVVVKNQDSGDTWTLTPADDAARAGQKGVAKPQP